MTTERRLLVGLGDIRAITLECKDAECGARLTLTPDKLTDRAVNTCPRCERVWISMSKSGGQTYVSDLAQLLTVFKDAWANQGIEGESSVRVLFEFEEPK